MHLQSTDLILIQSFCSCRMSLRAEGVQCGGVAVEFDDDNDRDSPVIKARNIPRMFLYLNQTIYIALCTEGRFNTSN